MPEMISLRNFRLSTTRGHMIQFAANTPTYVPDEVVADAMQAGCVPANDDERPFFDDMQKARIDFPKDLRSSIIHLAIGALMTENRVKNFDGAGMPKADVISKRVGFDVTNDERRTAFQLYQNVKKGGADFAVHKDADKVMAVVDAADQSELFTLADEYGVPKEQSRKMMSKDLRKLLLAKFSALVA